MEDYTEGYLMVCANCHLATLLLYFRSRCPATVECSAHSDEAAWDYTRYIQKEPQDPSF